MHSVTKHIRKKWALKSDQTALKPWLSHSLASDSDLYINLSETQFPYV